MSEALLSLVYVGDPMCSWCWGFAPEIERLAETYPVEVVVGGLRPGPSAEVLEDRMASYLSRHWEEVSRRSGQPFDSTFLDARDGWVYDTEPAAIAVTVMRDMSPDHTLDFFTSVQHAFYAEGVDVTDYDELTRLSGRFAVSKQRFGDQLRSEEAKKAAWSDFSQARSWGISGFPTLVGRLTEGRLALLARGWTSAEQVEATIASIDRSLAG